MKSILKGISILFIVIPSMLFAADIPELVEGEEALDGTNCVALETNNCINNICLTSEDRDCQDKCATEAQDKCANEAE